MMTSPSLAWRFYMDVPFDEAVALPRAGCSTEHPLVFDRVARELVQMAERGLLEIVEQDHAERMGERVFERLVFRRRRPS
jgi:hypothetical protein